MALFNLDVRASWSERLPPPKSTADSNDRFRSIVLKNSLRKFEFARSEKIRPRQSLSVGLNVQIVQNRIVVAVVIQNLDVYL
ncbi:hypothetical protein EAH75_08945 [Rhodanobacter glycinis]|uniref:Uncharacterized protein n=2 Tax=Rhodanobacter glycinis TaxID=582702 RepID=A0A502CBS4_9GAMM|nr:hypothetical protein EAH88_00515 [Rhodanobacter glycinis]TPG48563.1 hypothetical protein EAH75_08945 [Rhodanobacter glycinis]